MLYIACLYEPKSKIVAATSDLGVRGPESLEKRPEKGKRNQQGSNLQPYVYQIDALYHWAISPVDRMKFYIQNKVKFVLFAN